MKVYSYPSLKCGLGLRARLLLENEVGVEGCGFGYPTTAVGEVVFSTAHTGYTESLTDPSYRGQILVSTHPMMGNYGVPARTSRIPQVLENYESSGIQVEGYIVSNLPSPNHYASLSSLHSWMASEGKPGLYSVDTRFLVKAIREKGVVMGVLAVYPESGEPLDWSELRGKLLSTPPYGEVPFAYEVSPSKPVTHRPLGLPKASVGILDCGVKHGILRSLLGLGVEVTRYPCRTKPDLIIDSHDAVIVSNGPGNPSLLVDEIRSAGDIAVSGKPVLGICLGMQLIALGLGAESYKLPYGHRAVNKPVVESGSGRCYVTTHNHGYAIDEESLGEAGLSVWFIQPDDGTLEGFKSRDGRVMAVQFHPEGGPGPWDTTWVFERFASEIKGWSSVA